MLTKRSLTWWPEHECGFFPAQPSVDTYGPEYWAKYAAYAETEMGCRLNVARVALVNRHYSGTLVDIGIGAGSFIRVRQDTHGYDVNPGGAEWLNRRGLWWNPYQKPCRAASLWDVLEHIADFPALLDCVREYVFVSMPVFTGPDHILQSKHFRKDEHYWYFTRHGFIRLMSALGWRCLEVNGEETLLGREDIASFVFRRRGDNPC